MTKRKTVLFTLLFLYAGGISQPAYAYLDPGTGTIILQSLLGGIAGIVVVGRLYWQQIKNVFRKERPDCSPQEDEQ